MILPSLEIDSDAVISPMGEYRYWLHRQWSSRGGWLLFVMLNPSTADYRLNDPTIRRCITFGKSNAYQGIIVVNLFAGRASTPEKLFRMEDPEGPDNPRYIEHAIDIIAEIGGNALIAWGSNAMGLQQSLRIRHRVKGLLGRRVFCLGITKGGHPRHPLFVKSNEPISRYEATEKV